MTIVLDKKDLKQNNIIDNKYNFLPVINSVDINKSKMSDINKDNTNNVDTSKDYNKEKKYEDSRNNKEENNLGVGEFSIFSKYFSVNKLPSFYFVSPLMPDFKKFNRLFYVFKGKTDELKKKKELQKCELLKKNSDMNLANLPKTKANKVKLNRKLSLVIKKKSKKINKKCILKKKVNLLWNKILNNNINPLYKIKDPYWKRKKKNMMRYNNTAGWNQDKKKDFRKEEKYYMTFFMDPLDNRRYRRIDKNFWSPDQEAREKRISDDLSKKGLTLDSITFTLNVDDKRNPKYKAQAEKNKDIQKIGIEGIGIKPDKVHQVNDTTNYLSNSNQKDKINKDYMSKNKPALNPRELIGSLMNILQTDTSPSSSTAKKND